MRGTPEGRRLFAACAGFGLGVGAVAGLGSTAIFGKEADFVLCNPGDPTDLSLCREHDVVGFELHSGLNAALTIGPIVALIAFVVCVVFVLFSDTHHHPHHHA